MSADRRRRATELVERYPLQDPTQFANAAAELAAAGRFTLVEVAHHHDGRHFLSSHANPDDAARYHDEQEYAEDWLIVVLVDLDTGDSYSAETRTVFTRAA